MSPGCALDTDGRAYCWGTNTDGRLGTGSGEGPETCSTGSCASAPVAVSGDLEFTEISVGSMYACALSQTGDVYCWGRNVNGELGTGVSGVDAFSSTPVRVLSSLKFVTLSAGERHTCALSENGAAYCWGWNIWGQVGPSAVDTCIQVNGSPFACSTTPVLAAEGFAFVAIAASNWHTCGLATDRATYCWGAGHDGRFALEPDSAAEVCPYPGQVYRYCSSHPVRVSGGLSFALLTAGGAHTCGLTEDGQAYCWGGNVVAQLGDCSLRRNTAVPQPVCGGLRFTLLEAGGGHTCGIATDGAAYCWGRHDVGQLGTGRWLGTVVNAPLKVDQPQSSGS